MRDDVIIIGAGPVGLLLGTELARRGVRARILERRPEAGSGSRAIGIHAPVLAALEPSGITDRVLADAARVSRGEARDDRRALGTVRFDRLRVRFPFVATLPQATTEAALAAGGPPVTRNTEVTAIRDVGSGVRVEVADAHGRRTLETRIAVIASGASGRALAYRRSAVSVREHPDRYLMADVAGDVGDESVAIVHLGRDGVLESFPLPGGRRYVLWDTDPAADRPNERRTRLRTALLTRGEVAGGAALSAVTAFRVRTAVAPALRNGRRLVIGDAAHEISPIGGQGMNLGLLDAVTLAPLLAEWLTTGDAPTALADWERRRIASARTAARLATMNTALGRALPPAAHATRSAGLRAALAGPTGRLFARAYAMGFDRGGA